MTPAVRRVESQLLDHEESQSSLLLSPGFPFPPHILLPLLCFCGCFLFSFCGAPGRVWFLAVLCMRTHLCVRVSTSVWTCMLMGRRCDQMWVCEQAGWGTVWAQQERPD